MRLITKIENCHEDERAERGREMELKEGMENRKSDLMERVNVDLALDCASK
jgi:hypothetical protein